MIEEVYAIEISGICNMVCKYCPYHLMQRPRGYMKGDTLSRVLILLETGKLKASNPLHLHLFGEPMLHPSFLEMAEMVKGVWPHISFSTNGTGITYDIAERLAGIGFDWITVSPHDMRKGSTAYYILKAQGNEVRVHGGPDHNWAGQVDSLVTWNAPCEFGEWNKVVIRWNGDVAVCCITDNQEGVIGSIWDEDILEKEHVEIPMCKKCHLERRDHGKADRQTVSVDRASTVSPR